MLALIETTSPAHHWLRKVRHIAACRALPELGGGLGKADDVPVELLEILGRCPVLEDFPGMVDVARLATQPRHSPRTVAVWRDAGSSEGASPRGRQRLLLCSPPDLVRSPVA